MDRKYTDTKDTLHDDYYIPAANRLTTRAKVFLLTFLLSPNVCTDASSENIRRAFVNGIRAPHYHHSVVRMYCILHQRMRPFSILYNDERAHNNGEKKAKKKKYNKCEIQFSESRTPNDRMDWNEKRSNFIT